MNAGIAIQVLPKAAGSTEIVRIADEAISYIRSFGLHTKAGPFETTIEGDQDSLMEILRGCSKISTDGGAPVVMTAVAVQLPELSRAMVERHG